MTFIVKSKHQLRLTMARLPHVVNSLAHCLNNKSVIKEYECMCTSDRQQLRLNIESLHVIKKSCTDRVEGRVGEVSSTEMFLAVFFWAPDLR